MPIRAAERSRHMITCPRPMSEAFQTGDGDGSDAAARRVLGASSVARGPVLDTSPAQVIRVPAYQAVLLPSHPPLGQQWAGNRP